MPTSTLGFPPGGNILHVLVAYGMVLRHGEDAGLGLVRRIVELVVRLRPEEMERRTVKGLTPLMASVAQTNTIMMDVLLEYGASTLWG